MSAAHIVCLNRRDFLKSTALAASAAAAGGLVLGFYPERAEAQFGGGGNQAIVPEAFIHIAPDDTITLTVHKPENGQGAETAIAMLLAEELECDWASVRTRFAPIDAALYGGPLQGTFGSNGVRTSWLPMRRTGAAAREMLIQAAAQRWGVAPAQCRAQNGMVRNVASGETLRYGALAEDAARLPVPSDVALKEPGEYRLIGRPTHRLDTRAKVRGEATYGIDVRMEGMVHAAVERCPVIRGSVVSYDATPARAVRGVLDVIQIPQGVAVLAENTWAAFEGRRALRVEWDEGVNAGLSSDGIREKQRGLIAEPGVVARSAGDGAAALERAASRVEADYEAPYLAHACMEPYSAVAVVTADRCDVWTGTQIPGISHGRAVEASGLPPQDVHIHTLYMGGGFGGRGGSGPWVEETVEIAKRAGVPVKVTWTREEDLQYGSFRPVSYVRFAAGLDEDGWPLAWTGRVSCSPVLGGMGSAVEGLVDTRYDIPHVQLEYHDPEINIPVNPWRAVGYSQNIFFSESFVDELAAAAGKDPVEYRRRLVAHDPRMLAVLELAAERANWGGPLPSGRHRGVAIARCFGSFNAQIAEVSVEQGRVRVHRIVCVLDCGTAVNPIGVVQQMEGGIVFGLSAALRGNITLERGRIQQTNFHQYEPLRIDEMPVVEVHIVPSDAPPAGVGEVGNPATTPAVTNAIYSATGVRIRQLPIGTQLAAR